MEYGSDCISYDGKIEGISVDESGMILLQPKAENAGSNSDTQALQWVEMKYIVYHTAQRIQLESETT